MRTLFHLRAFTLAATAIALPTATQNRVLTVDDDGAADFTTIQAAVDAAAAGDVLLVRDGTYLPFTIDGKGVTILGDAGAAVAVSGAGAVTSTIVRGLPASERVTFRNLRFVTQAPEVVGNLVQVLDCDGLVWLEGITIDPPDVPIFYRLGGIAALLVQNTQALALIDSGVFGANGTSPGLESGAVALRAIDSQVFVHGCVLRGGNTLVEVTQGRDGIRIEGGSIVLRDCTVVGGPGGGSTLLGSQTGDGGPGLRAVGAEVWSIATDLIGGPPGQTIFGQGTGQQGPPFLNSGGTVHEVAAPRATLQTTVVARDGDDDSFRLELQTIPRATLVLLVTLVPDPVLLDVPRDLLGVGLEPVLFDVGRSDATGGWAQDIDIPPLPAGLSTWNASVQLAAISAQAELALSNPSILHVVDDRF